MPSKYARKRKHDLDQDTSTEAKSEVSKSKSDTLSSKNPREKSEKSKNSEESISIEETNRIRAELGLSPLEVDASSEGDNAAEAVAKAEGGTLFKEDGVDIVHKAAKNWSEDKESAKMREKLDEQKKKHHVYSKVLKTTKGLADSDSEEDGNVDSFLDRMREQAQKKAQAFDSMDQEAEKDAAALTKKLKQKKLCKKNDMSTAGLLVGHSKEDFVDGTETILVLQDKNVLDDDTEELLINPNLVDNERHKRNVERRKQKSDYNQYDEETVDEFGMVKKQGILDKYDEVLDGGEKREAFRLDKAGGYDLDREEQELEIKRRLMMANKQFETLETPKYIQAREFYTEEEMLTFRKPKKKKEKSRKSRTLKASDLEVIQEDSLDEKMEKAKRLAARRRDRGEHMKIDEVSKNEPVKESKSRKYKAKKEMEEGEVDDSEPQSGIAAPASSKWKQGLGASVDLSRIRSFAARVDEEQDEESDDEKGFVHGANLGGVTIDDEAEDELHGALARTRKLKQIFNHQNEQEDRAKYVRQMLSDHGVMKLEPKEDEDTEEYKPLSEYSDGLLIDATSEQYKMIGEIPTFGLAGNRNDDVDYSELVAEHKRIAEQQAREEQQKEYKYSDDDEELSDDEAEIKTSKLKRRRGNDNDMDVDDEEQEPEIKKPTWKTIGDEEPTALKRASDVKSLRSYRKGRSKHDDDDEVYGADYQNVLGEERDVTKGVGAMLRLAAEKGYLEQANRNKSGSALKHLLESKRFSRVEQGRMDIEDKYIRKLERMGTSGSGPIRPFSEKSDYKPNVEITYTDKQGRLIEEKEAFRELSHKFHGKGSGKKQLEKRQAKLNKKERMKQMNSADTPLGTLQKQLKKQEQLQSPFIILSGSNRSDMGAPLQKD